VSKTVAQPEALKGMRSALNDWAKAAKGLSVQADAATAALRGEVERELRRRTTELSALEAALRAAPKDEQATLAEKVRCADRGVEAARRALTLATDANRRAEELRRRTDDTASGLVPRASRALEHKLRALSDYAAAPVSSAGGSEGSAGPVGYGVSGIADVPLDQVRFDDNPIRGGFGRGDADVGDYRWATETWESVVRPGVLAGKIREDFARRDTERGQHVGFRRTAGVYDMFLGDDSIRLSRRSDGSFDVVGGRHRIEVARQLGITHLPARIHG